MIVAEQDTATSASESVSKVMCWTSPSKSIINGTFPSLCVLSTNIDFGAGEQSKFEHGQPVKQFSWRTWTKRILNRKIEQSKNYWLRTWQGQDKWSFLKLFTHCCSHRISSSQSRIHWPSNSLFIFTHESRFIWFWPVSSTLRYLFKKVQNFITYITKAYSIMTINASIGTFQSTWTSLKYIIKILDYICLPLLYRLFTMWNAKITHRLHKSIVLDHSQANKSYRCYNLLYTQRN